MNDRTNNIDEMKLTAYALGELDADDAAEVEKAIENDEALRAEVESIRATAQMLTGELSEEPAPTLTAEQREALAQEPKKVLNHPSIFTMRTKWAALGLAAAAMITLAIFVPAYWQSLDRGSSLSDDDFAFKSRSMFEAMPEMQQPSPMLLEDANLDEMNAIRNFRLQSLAKRSDESFAKGLADPNQAVVSSEMTERDEIAQMGASSIADDRQAGLLDDAGRVNEAGLDKDAFGYANGRIVGQAFDQKKADQPSAEGWPQLSIRKVESESAKENTTPAKLPAEKSGLESNGEEKTSVINNGMPDSAAKPQMIGGGKIAGNRNAASPPPANKPVQLATNPGANARGSRVSVGGRGGISPAPKEEFWTSYHALTTEGIRGREYDSDVVDELSEQELVSLKVQLDKINTSTNDFGARGEGRGASSRGGGQFRSSDEERSRLDLVRNKRWLESRIQKLVRRGRANEAYAPLIDNPWTRPVGEKALSTFSIDVDTASYANMRRFVSQGSLPPRDAVRIEEMVNYFKYNYDAPTEESEHPFAAHVEIADAPWNEKHRLVRIGLKGREVAMDQRPATNLVFLIDVSGSMQPRNKLPLLKQSMRLLVEHLNGDDTIAIVTYAGNSGLVLPATHCDARESILGAIDRLSAGGSTNGGAGIDLAYRLAVENFISGGINRVILATDGDFNVGVTQMSELLTLIERRRKTGVFLSVLGFGEGNIKDDKMELLADKGNGNYSYIDTLKEARKVLVEEATSTLMTIAKDVKIQVEFNPAKVGAYRLIGYANRMLKAKDFNNDRIDAGEIGAGHTVTALYEIVPPGVAIEGDIDNLKYQQPVAEDAAPDVEEIEVVESDELFTLKIRYKQPEAAESTKFEIPVIDEGGTLDEASDDFRFASAVAAYGMILRNSEYRGGADYEMVCALAGSATGSPGIRREALQYREDFIHYTMTANVELALANARALLKLKLSDLELAMIFRNGGLSPEKLNLVLTRALSIEDLSEVAGQLRARLDNGMEILSRVEVRPKSNYRSEFIELVLKAAAISRPRIRPVPMPGPEN